MREEFLHYLWRFLRFNSTDLRTTENLPITIRKPGLANTNAGPDFLQAEIQIDGVLWAGHVEIHLKASDWDRHQHQLDAAYNNVILHVVLESDKPITTQAGAPLQTLELKSRIDFGLYEQYRSFLSARAWVPCENQIRAVPGIVVAGWLDNLMGERLQQKTAAIEALLGQSKNDWEATFYRMLLRAFGSKVNAEAFHSLAAATPLSILRKHLDNPFQLEAILLGQAGLLAGNFHDPHAVNLKKEYLFLANKYKLSAIPVSSMRFLRLRPSNFPTIRLAQFASVLGKRKQLLAAALEAENYKELLKLLGAGTSDYWNTHYNFEKESTHKRKRIGRSFSDGIIINTIVPFLFVYGQKMGREEQSSKAIELLQGMKSEKNNIITNWEKCGVAATNSLESQALLQLHNHYCTYKKCLNCRVGIHLLKAFSGDTTHS